jgi:restriction system protein
LRHPALLEALQFKSQLSPRIVLIDGAELGQLMVKHGIGVQEKKIYKVVEIDEDYFEED